MRALGLGVLAGCLILVPPAWGANGTIAVTGSETRDEVRFGL